jgi:hypothetical protein
MSQKTSYKTRVQREIIYQEWVNAIARDDMKYAARIWGANPDIFDPEENETEDDRI